MLWQSRENGLGAGGGHRGRKEVREAATTVGRDEGNLDQEETGWRKKRTTGKTLEMEVTGLLGGLWQVARGSIRSDTQVSGFGGWVRAGVQDGEAGLGGEGRGQRDIWGISPPSGNKGGKGLGAELHTRPWDSQCY